MSFNVSGVICNICTPDQIEGKKNKLLQVVQEMGLKEVGSNVYTTLSNDGIFYVWNPSTEQMEQLPSGSIGRDGNYTNGLPVNNGTLQQLKLSWILTVIWFHKSSMIKMAKRLEN